MRSNEELLREAMVDAWAIASADLRQAFQLAARMAKVRGSEYHGVVHQLFGLLKCEDAVMAEIAAEYWISGESIWQRAGHPTSDMVTMCSRPPLTPYFKEIFASAGRRARELGKSLECVDILMGIVERPDNPAAQALAEYGLDQAELTAFLARRE